MPAEPLVGQARQDGSHRRYCCYGCRLLGESGQKTLAEMPAAETTWFKIGVGAVIAGQAMLLGLAVNLAAPTGSTRLLLHAALILSALAVFAILGVPLWRAALDSLGRRQITIELLFLAGVVGAFGASLHSTLTGFGAVYYEVVAILLTVYTVGKTLGARSRARALAESRKLQDAFDACRILRSDGSVVTRRAVEVKPGDRIQVFAGEAIPIDGRVVRGAAFIRETPLTGEPFPVVRRDGDEVFAGSYSEDGELVIEATTRGNQRRLDGLLAMVTTARDVPSAIQAEADRLVRWFLPLVLVVALGTFGFWTVRQGFTVGLFNALAVLLVACPCAMGLATPVGLWNGLASLAARGLVPRHGDLIDRLAAVTHVVFDKTGTLSEERLSLIDLASADNAMRRHELLDLLHAVQARSSHPVARAFVGDAARSVPPSLEVRSVKTVPARGLEAWVQSADGRELHLRIGRRELMSDLTTEAPLLAGLRHTPADNLVYVEVDDRLEAVAAVRERLRDSTPAAMAAVEALGVTVTVMTGDQATRARQLGLAPVRGDLTPTQKAQAVETLQCAGARVGFVGDGVNDAVALGVATVGIALDHGAGLATAQADAVLYGGDLRVVPWAVALCRQVRASIRANLLFAAAYNTIGVVLAASGCLHPVVAALLMVLSSAVVSWRALRCADGTEPCCGLAEVQVVSGGRNPARADGARADVGVGSPGTRMTGILQGLDLRPAKFYGVLVALQGPYIAWLGGLWSWSAAAVVLMCLALGFGITRARTRNPELQRYAGMAGAMLGAGNWGMLLGWWADAGFSPVVQNGVCLGCHPHSLLAAGAFHLPWMYVGMLILGLPPMLRDAANRAGLNRVWLGVLSALGMMAGMGYGGALAVEWTGSTASFLPALVGMTLGMLLGMLFCCELGRL
ncbi:MAG: cation-translocating P-type ATPase, partial [Verrucomicrobia bacterium]|nr:cation-translocating P-type ATPase [Verrucomicrobiota bacterium]